MSLRTASIAPSPAPDVSDCVAAFETELDFVHRTLRRQGVASADVEDLMQEVFIAMWRAWAQFDRTRPLRPWLWGISFRVARNHLRRRWREVPAEQLDVADDAPPAGEEGLAAARARALVLRALARLPEKYRTPLIRHELDGVPVNELAEQLDLPLATAYTRVRRARLAFAEVLRALPGASAIALEAEALLEHERHPPPASARSRAAVLARLRDLPPPAPPSPLRWLAPAVAAAVVLVLVAVRWSRPAPPPSPALASPTPATVAPPPPDLEKGLTGHWRLDGLPDSLARDSSGNGRDCHLRDPERVTRLVDGHQDVGVELGGKAWLECPLPPVAAGQAPPMTVAIWANVRSYPELHAALATRQLGTGFEDYFFLGFEQDHLRFNSSVWGGYMTTTTPLPRERWFHVAFTHDAQGTTRLFLDGVEVAAAPDTHADKGPVDTVLTLGAGHYSRFRNSVRQRLDGTLDDARIYDRALSPIEIAALARSK